MLLVEYRRAGGPRGDRQDRRVREGGWSTWSEVIVSYRLLMVFRWDGRGGQTCWWWNGMVLGAGVLMEWDGIISVSFCLFYSLCRYCYVSFRFVCFILVSCRLRLVFMSVSFRFRIRFISVSCRFHVSFTAGSHVSCPFHFDFMSVLSRRQEVEEEVLRR